MFELHFGPLPQIKTFFWCRPQTQRLLPAQRSTTLTLIWLHPSQKAWRTNKVTWPGGRFTALTCWCRGAVLRGDCRHLREASSFVMCMDLFFPLPSGLLLWRLTVVKTESNRWNSDLCHFRSVIREKTANTAINVGLHVNHLEITSSNRYCGLTLQYPRRRHRGTPHCLPCRLSPVGRPLWKARSQQDQTWWWARSPSLNEKKIKIKITIDFFVPLPLKILSFLYSQKKQRFESLFHIPLTSVRNRHQTFSTTELRPNWAKMTDFRLDLNTPTHDSWRLLVLTRLTHGSWRSHIYGQDCLHVTLLLFLLFNFQTKLPWFAQLGGTVKMCTISLLFIRSSRDKWQTFKMLLLLVVHDG